jgi:hypothetical protein
VPAHCGVGLGLRKILLERWIELPDVVKKSGVVRQVASAERLCEPSCQVRDIDEVVEQVLPVTAGIA